MKRNYYEEELIMQEKSKPWICEYGTARLGSGPGRAKVFGVKGVYMQINIRESEGRKEVWLKARPREGAAEGEMSVISKEMG